MSVEHCKLCGALAAGVIRGLCPECVRLSAPFAAKQGSHFDPPDSPKGWDRLRLNILNTKGTP